MEMGLGVSTAVCMQHVLFFIIREFLWQLYGATYRCGVCTTAFRVFFFFTVSICTETFLDTMS